MIERIVFLKLQDEFSNAAGRVEVASHSAPILAAIPGVQEVEIGRAGDGPTAADWDLSLRLRFASLEDVESYRVHPQHREYVDSFLKPRLAAIRAWNFEVEAGQ